MNFSENLVVFSKIFKEKNTEELVKLAHKNNFCGYDLCVREGWHVNPRNVGSALEQTVTCFRKEGLEIPMVTGEVSLVHPETEGVRDLLRAMDESGIRLLKPGYFRFDPADCDYWTKVSEARRSLSAWERLGRDYNVKICFHTHSMRCLGLNCASLMHLLEGFDPGFIGAYIDPCHMEIEGEEFSAGLCMVRKYLSIVALKDVLIYREAKAGHGIKKHKMVPAGDGMVDWTAVFSGLAEIKFDGPLSIHCEFEADKTGFEGLFKKEVEYFKNFRPGISGS